MKTRKPRHWIEHLRVVVHGDYEHRMYIEEHGLEEYLQREIWKLSDFEVGQLMHPGMDIVYGKIRRPDVEASLESRVE